jgi:hypothetical protein
MIVTISITTVVWLVVTLLTSPEREETLCAFYRRVRPAAAGWKPIAMLAPEITPARDGWWNLLDAVCGCLLIYGTLFGLGKLLLKETGIGVLMLAVGLTAGAVIYWDLTRRGWRAVAE